MIATRSCPFCGRLLVKDDAALTIAHQAPECAEFKALVQRAGKAETRHVPLSKLGAHFARQRAKVRRRTGRKKRR